MKTLEKDILLICKGWYSEQYKDILDAFNAYYHREYGFNNITMDKGFSLTLFLEPTIIKMSEYSASIIRNLFSTTCRESDIEYSKDFTNIMYDRCVTALINIPCRGDKWTDYLSDYSEMLNQSREEQSECKITII